MAKLNKKLKKPKFSEERERWKTEQLQENLIILFMQDLIFLNKINNLLYGVHGFNKDKKHHYKNHVLLIHKKSLKLQHSILEVKNHKRTFSHQNHPLK